MPKPKKADQPSVFFSHAHEDADCAAAIGRWLYENLSAGVEIFDSTDLPAGTDWPNELRKALMKASLVLSLITPNSIQREWVYFESGAGYGRGRPVIPICWGGIRVSDLTPPLKFLQSVDVPGKERKLLDSVAKE